MPELPEVETVRRGLEPVLVGQEIVGVEQNRPNLRFAFPDHFARRIEGAQVLRLERRAKYIMARLTTDETLIIHLGMTGRFKIVAPSSTEQTAGLFYYSIKDNIHDHVVFHLKNGTKIIYNDTRRFGFMDLVATNHLDQSFYLKNLGLEPLSKDLTGDALLALFKGKKTPLKSALLDQRLVAGLGNIYVCEALFRAKLHPLKASGTLDVVKAQKLAQIIQDVLLEALEAGGSTLRDFAHTDGSLGYFQHRFKVYDREGDTCHKPECGHLITRIVQAGRSTFLCEGCQK